MRKPLRLSALVIVLVLCGLFVTFFAPSRSAAVDPESSWLITGRVVDRQSQPVEGADVAPAEVAERMVRVVAEWMVRVVAHLRDAVSLGELSDDEPR